VTDLAALVVRMQADNSQYIKALDQATGKLQSFAKDQNEALAGLAEKIGEAFAVDKIVEFAASSIESAASLERLSQSAGVSVESLSAMRLAATASGLSQDELGRSLKKLNVNISEAAGNAGSKAAIAFKALGISVTDANGNLKTADQILPDLANKFASMADGPNKTAFAVQLLGRQGQALIPVLDQGAAGLAAFKAQAEAAGLVISGSTAAAAEEFSQKIAVLKATLVDGLGIQLTAKLLPVLTELVDQFESAGNAGSTLATIADVLVGAVKLVAAGVIEGINEFKQFGDSIGALAAIAVAVAHGQFSEASSIWKASNEDNLATQKSTEDRLTALFAAGGADQLAVISTTEAQKKRIMSAGPSLEGAEQSAAALKELQKYSDGIKDQASAFGLGGAALTAYKLQFGPLAEAIKQAGAEGQKLAAQAQGWANKLQFSVDSKKTADATRALQEQVTQYGAGDLAAEAYKITTGELGDAFNRMGNAGHLAQAKLLEIDIALIKLKDASAIDAINNKTLELTGHLNAAALAAYDLQNRALKENLTGTGDSAGLDALAAQRAQVDAQSQINELNEKATLIKDQLEITETKLNAEVATGQLTELAGEQALSSARILALTQLQGLATQEQTIADTSGSTNLQLVAGVQKFQSSLVSLQATTTQLTNTVRSGLESAFADNFEKLITGAESFRKALQSFFKDLEKQLDQLVSKDISQSIFGTGGAGGGIAGAIAGVFGGGIGGGGGGGLSGIAGLFGGGASSAIAPTATAATGTSMDSLIASLPAFAEGGTLPANSWGMVGERGKELVYSGAQNMNVVPAGGGKQVSVTNHFSVQAPGGTISRASQMQTAAAAARSLAQANRRNNQ
jgi:hypothetical protein